MLLLLLLLLARDTSPRFPWAKEKRRGVHAQKILLDASTRAYINILNRAAFAKSKHSNFAQARTKLDFY